MKRFAIAVAFIVTGSAIGFGSYELWGSSLLELRRVEVAGNQRVAKEELVRASELRRGQHLLSLSTNRVVSAVETIPWVEHARAERIIPSTVRITVIERTPVALVSSGARRFLIDEEGVILDEGSNEFVIINDLPIAAVVPGARVRAPSFRESLGVWRDFDDSLREQVEFISAASIDRITVRLSGGVSILYGAHEQVEEKNFAIMAVLEQAKRDGDQIVSVDVRVPRRPAVRTR